MGYIVRNGCNVLIQEVTIFRLIINTSENSFDEPIGFKSCQSDACRLFVGDISKIGSDKNSSIFGSADATFDFIKIIWSNHDTTSLIILYFFFNENARFYVRKKADW